MLRNLDTEDTLTLKGMAILWIALHNYFHVTGSVRENQFNFDPARLQTFLTAFQNPSESIQATFAFLGHFGVQVFIFLTAYGLAKKYWETELNPAAFLWSRVKKLYPMILTVVGVWVIIAGFKPIWENGVELCMMLLGVSNLLPGYGIPPIGPWWFIPFIVQVYFLWPAIRWIAVRTGMAGLLGVSAASLVITYVGNPVLDPWMINLLETPVGHMPELCLGVVAARFPLSLKLWAVPLLGAAVGVGSLYRPLWLLTFTCALLIVVTGYVSLRPLCRLKWLAFVGRCSMAVFLVNGIIRVPFIIGDKAVGQWPVTLLFGIVSTIMSLALATYLESVMGKLRAVPQIETTPVTFHD
jgi:peptidoglycan/LPS O-acetylase OafA/YrhL